jgi:hypothetical protein
MADGYNPETGHTRLTKIDGEWAYITEREYVEMNAYADEDNILRWDSNGRVVPYDVLRTAGYDEEFRAQCREVEERENSEMIQEYIQQQREFDADTSLEAMAIKREQAWERRAAFGEGAEVVDVFSGRKYRA